MAAPPAKRSSLLNGSLLALPLLIALASACNDHAPARFETTRMAAASVQGGTADSQDTGVVLIYASLGGGTYSTCTGSLIARNVVLTARHCVATTTQSAIDCTSAQFGTGYSAAGFSVFNDQKLSKSTFAYGVKKVVVTPGKTLCGNDVALLVLAQAFHPSTATLIEPRFSPVSPEEAYSAVGFGKTCPGCADGGQARNRRDGLAVSCLGSACGWDNWEVNINEQEWAGDDGVCSGDSGGPALDSEGRVIGIASRAAEDGGQCVLSLYERVDSWADLITQTTLEAAVAAGIDPPAWAGTPSADAGVATPPTCTACQRQAIVPGDLCSAEYSACTKSAECLALIECREKCTTESCREQCSTAHPSGDEAWQPVLDCICQKACPSPCESTCNGTDAGTVVEGGAAQMDPGLSPFQPVDESGCSVSGERGRSSCAWLIAVASLLACRRRGLRQASRASRCPRA